MRREKTHKNGHDYEKGKKRGSTRYIRKIPEFSLKSVNVVIMLPALQPS